MHVPCPDCRGTGQVIEEDDKCPLCCGQKVVEEQKIVEVFIEKGMRHGEKVYISPSCSLSPEGKRQGDECMWL